MERHWKPVDLTEDEEGTFKDLKKRGFDVHKLEMNGNTKIVVTRSRTKYRTKIVRK